MKSSAQQLPLNFRPMKPRTADSIKGVVSALYDQVGGVGEVMVRLGIGKSQAYAFTDEVSPEQISLARAMALTGPGATAVAEYAAARAGAVLCAIPKADRRGTTMARLAASAQSHGEAIAEAIKAIADGKVTPAERARVRKEIAEAICDLVSLQASLEDGE